MKNVSHWPPKLWEYIDGTHHECIKDGANIQETTMLATSYVFVVVNPKETSTMRSRAVSGVVVAIISAPSLHASHLEDKRLGVKF